jgi:hypothetical protein
MEGLSSLSVANNKCVRNWIFRPEIITPRAPLPQPAHVPLPNSKHTRDFLLTEVTLFRFSALTFNAHKIHYNKKWCQEVEGHRDLVVHVSLTFLEAKTSYSGFSQE